MSNQSEPVLLKVGSSTDPQKAAGAVFKSIFDSHNYPKIRAIGHGAVGQAVKALAIARSHTAVRGVDLAFTCGFETILSDDGKEISAIVFNTFEKR